MNFNIKKCKSLHIGNKNQGTEYFMIDDKNKIEKIKQVEEEKDLGVTFDKKLTFDKHISSKVNLANRNLGLIFRNFVYMNKEMFLHLYKSLVRPHLEYASVIWTPRFKKHAIQIENVQRRATRMLKDLRGLPYWDRLVQLGLPTLEYRRARADVIQVYKLINRLDLMVTELVTTRENTTTRGHNLKLSKPSAARLNIRKNAFKYRVVNEWNSLPNTVIEAKTLNSFKARLNNHWKISNKFNANCYRPY